MDHNKPRLPTFIIAGAQKSGTTSLHTYLKEHPAVYFPARPQELHFFDVEENYSQGIEAYKQFFSSLKKEHQAIGQTSPLYIYEPKVAPRIANWLPQVKLLFILRNPIDRAYSHYQHSIKKGYERLTFKSALEQEAVRIKQGRLQRSQFSYTDRGYYAHQLERYLSYFSKEQFLILLTENMSRDPVAIIDQCCDFLNIDRQGEQIITNLPETHWNRSGLPRSHRIQRLTARWRTKSRPFDRFVWWIDRLNLKSTPYPPLDPHLRQKLASLFAPENERLATLFNLDLSAWRQQAAEKSCPNFK